VKLRVIKKEREFSRCKGGGICRAMPPRTLTVATWEEKEGLAHLELN